MQCWTTITTGILLLHLSLQAQASSSEASDLRKILESQSSIEVDGLDKLSDSKLGLDNPILVRRAILHQDLNLPPTEDVETHTPPLSRNYALDKDEKRKGSASRPEVEHLQVDGGTPRNAGQPGSKSGLDSQSPKPTKRKRRAYKSYLADEESVKRLKIAMDTSATIPSHTPWSRQLLIHGDRLKEAGLSVPDDTSLRNTIDWARRKRKRQGLASKYKQKASHVSIVRQVAKEHRGRPFDERRDIMAKEFEKAGLERPRFFHRTVIRLSQPSRINRLTSEMRKKQQEASSSKNADHTAKKSVDHSPVKNGNHLVRRANLGQDLNVEPHTEEEDLAHPVFVRGGLNVFDQSQGATGRSIPHTPERAHPLHGATPTHITPHFYVGEMSKDGAVSGEATQATQNSVRSPTPNSGRRRPYTAEHEERMRIISETALEIPLLTSWAKQIQIHGQKLRQAGLPVPNDKQLRHSIDWARRQRRRKLLLTQPPEVIQQHGIKSRQLSVMRSVARQARHAPLEERREIFNRAFARAGVEKPASFERSMIRVAQPYIVKGLAENKGKSEEPSSSKIGSHATSKLGKHSVAKDGMHLVRRADLDLNLEPHTEAEDLARPVFLQGGLDVAAERDEGAVSSAAQTQGSAQSSQDAPPRAIESWQGSVPDGQQDLVGLSGPSRPKNRLGRRLTAEGEKRWKTVSETSMLLPRSMPWAEQFRIHGIRLRQAGLSVPKESSLKHTIDSIRRRRRKEELLAQPPEVKLQQDMKRKQRSIMRRVARQVRHATLDERREIISEELEKAGVEKPPSFDRAVLRMAQPHVWKRLGNGKVKQGESSSLQDARRTPRPSADMVDTDNRRSSNHPGPRPHVRSLEDNVDSGHVLIRRGLRNDHLDLDMNALPKENDDAVLDGLPSEHQNPSHSSDQHASTPEHQRFEPERAAHKGKETIFEAGEATQVSSQSRTSSSPIPTDSHQQIGFPLITAQSGPSASFRSHADKSKYEGKDVDALRERWKQDKIKQKMAQQGQLSAKDQRLFDLHSEMLKERRAQRQAFEKANPAEKGRYLSWRRFKNAEKREQHRRFFNGEMSEEEARNYQQRREVYAYLQRKPKTPKAPETPRPHNSNTLMRSIRDDLQKIPDSKARKEFIAQAFRNANLPVPRNDQLNQKARSSVLYQTKKRKREEEKKSVLGGASSSHARVNSLSSLRVFESPTPPLQRSLRLDDGEMVLQRRGGQERDLNAPSKTSGVGQDRDARVQFGSNDALDLGRAPHRTSEQPSGTGLRLFGRHIFIGDQGQASHNTIVAAAMPSSSQARKSSSKRSGEDSASTAELREKWKKQKMKEKLAKEGKLPEEDLRVFQTRSEDRKKALEQRKEFERANPDKKGNFTAWRTSKQKEKREKRRKYLRGEFDEQEKREYEEHIKAYTHELPQPEKPRAKKWKPSEQSRLMQSIRGDLDKMYSLEEKMHFIVQAFQTAKLEVPTPDKLSYLAAHSHRYKTRKEGIEHAVGSSVDPPSKKTSTPSERLVRRASTHYVGDSSLRKGGLQDIDLNALPKPSTSSSKGLSSVREEPEIQSRPSSAFVPYQPVQAYEPDPIATRLTSAPFQGIVLDRPRSRLEARAPSTTAEAREIWRQKYHKSLLAKQNLLDPEEQAQYGIRSEAIRRGIALKRKRREEATANALDAADFDAEYQKLRQHEKYRLKKGFKTGTLTAEELQKYKANQVLYEKSGRKAKQRREGSA